MDAMIAAATGESGSGGASGGGLFIASVATAAALLDGKADVDSE